MPTENPNHIREEIAKWSSWDDFIIGLSFLGKWKILSCSIIKIPYLKFSIRNLEQQKEH